MLIIENVVCPKCLNEFQSESEFYEKEFVCPYCKSIFRINEEKSDDEDWISLRIKTLRCWSIGYYDAIELKVKQAKILISAESEKHFLKRDYQRLKLAIEEMEINKEILRERWKKNCKT